MPLSYALRNGYRIRYVESLFICVEQINRDRRLDITETIDMKGCQYQHNFVV